MNKYNFGVDINKAPYIKTHLTIQVTGQGYESGFPKFLYHNNEPGWEFYVNHDVDYLLTIDVWDVDESTHWIYKGTYLDFWNNINTVQLSQFDYFKNKPMYHRQNGGSYGEGAIATPSAILAGDIKGRIKNLTDGDGCLLTPGFFTYSFY
jgi:hypothetical protein